MKKTMVLGMVIWSMALSCNIFAGTIDMVEESKRDRAELEEQWRQEEQAKKLREMQYRIDEMERKAKEREEQDRQRKWEEERRQTQEMIKNGYNPQDDPRCQPENYRHAEAETETADSDEDSDSGDKLFSVDQGKNNRRNSSYEDDTPPDHHKLNKKKIMKKFPKSKSRRPSPNMKKFQ
jgi:TolA-binding protein